jgi:short-subunit dehydrogenase
VGRQLAKQLAAKGASLILWDLQYDKLSRLKLKLNNSANHKCYNVDVSKSDAIATTLNEICKSTKLDIIIANAGIVTGKSAKDLTDQDIDSTFGVNTRQHMYATSSCKLARPNYSHYGD